MKRWLVGVTILVSALIIAAGWVFRSDLKARYYAHKLLTVPQAESQAWVEQAGAWGDRVSDRLLDCLTSADAETCSRAGAALARIQSPATMARLVERFGRFSPQGQQAVLDCASTCPQIIRPALQSTDARVRLRAAALAMQPGMGQTDLLVPLLKDPVAEVRRTAILAVGPSRSLVADDDLLGWLHDPDADVRRFTEAALRSRGLRAVDVQMGRLLTDPRPAARLELLVHLRDDTALDLIPWLRKLCDDPAPAVRVAAARLAEERHVFQLTTKLDAMANTDPDLTVRQTVRYHLSQLQSEIRPASGP